jgi:hypothetical protein
MNSRTRQRAFRALLGSLLQSELTISEIRNIAEECYLGSFGPDFGNFLRNAMDTLDDANNRPKTLDEEPPTKELLELVNRRRLSKKEVVQLMTLAAPKIKSNSFPPSFPMMELLERFVATATLGEIQSFLNILQGEPADAYLKGISRRNREK